MLSAKLGENPSQVGSEILAKLDKRKCQPWVTMAEHGRCDLMIAVDTEKKIYIYCYYSCENPAIYFANQSSSTAL